ncbi:MAG: Asp-tRNA(Asn)/Glu-tRNA(Gln) amidotransferase subunit GatC [Archaeoglobi archaeon]|nr:Asp-tRNA(Asn)/Glu-tRNA(Gln) amidotransferase subunit GatC [Candidatus Mnemosynella sp.]
MIDEETVRHVSWLARIHLEENEIRELREELSKILEYFSVLDEVQEDVEPLYHVNELSNVFREDEPEEPLPREEVLRNAPKKENGYFKGPRIV